MIEALINPNDPIEEQNEKLIKIIESLMTRVERETDASGAAYAQFQGFNGLSRSSDLEIGCW